LDELTWHAISAWLAELAETCEPSTVATRLRGMRRFCRWLVVEGEVDKAPTEGIEIATAPDRPVPILTDAEITALSKTCAVGRGRPGVFARPIFFGRDEVVLRLLLGLRGPMTTDGAREVLNVRSAKPASKACTRTGSGTPSPTAG
jgi:site-specific recombinase XerD